jgi:hypothetical protein
LAILVAGGIQLFRVTGDSSASDDLGFGDRAVAGDMVVTVVSAEEVDGLMRVQLTLSGLDDDNALDDFRLVVPGAALRPLSPAQAGQGACDDVTVAEQTCSLVFGTATVDGSARVLLVRRGEDQHRWTLA